MAIRKPPRRKASKPHPDIDPPPRDTNYGGAPPGIWLVAGTPGDQPYPCRCHERRYSKCSPTYCPCAGRTDLHDGLPDECCAVQAARTKTNTEAGQ